MFSSGQIVKNEEHMVKRVCVYGRVSTTHEEQDSSLVTQAEMFRRWLELHKSEGFILVDEISERRTGTIITKRPKFIQMIEDTKADKYDYILFKDSKRFSRNMEDFLRLVEDLQRMHKYIIFITEGINTEFETDRTKLAMLGMFAESYSNQLHTNLQNALRIRFESELGRVPGDVFGYKRVKGDSSKAVIIPEQADIIRELFNRYADGEGISSIAKDFIERDIRTYRGGKMSMFALRRYIRNPLYKGLLIMNKYSKTDVRADRELNDESQWIVRQRPDLQIVEESLWDKCNSIMDANKQKMNDTTNGKIGYKPNILTDKLFSKVIVCEECGRNYNRKESHHKNKDKRYIYLMCGYKKYNKNNQANLEPCGNEVVIRLDYMISIVSKVIEEILRQSDGLEEIVRDKITSIIKEKYKSEIDKQTETKLKEAKEKQRRLGILFKDGLVDEDEYIAIRNEVKKLEVELKRSKVKQLTSEEIHVLVTEFISNLSTIISESLVDEGGVDVKSFNRLFSKIVVNKDTIDIYFRALKDTVGAIEIRLNEEISVVRPVVDNKLSGCNSVGAMNKKIKRHSKARWSSERNGEFIGLDDEDINGRDTNQVIVNKEKMKVRVYLI